MVGSNYINNPLEGNITIYTSYVSGIFCQLGDYILLTTLYKNQNNPLIRSKQNPFKKPPDPVVVEQTEMERQGLSLRGKAGGFVDDCVGGWQECYEVGPYDHYKWS